MENKLKVNFTSEEIGKMKYLGGANANVNDVVVLGSDHYFKFPKRINRLVLITSGTYLSNDRISNYWYWKEINSDGTLGKSNSGYGGSFFRPSIKYKIETKIKLK